MIFLEAQEKLFSKPFAFHCHQRFLYCFAIQLCIASRGIFQLAGEVTSHLLMTVEDEAPEGGVAEEEGGGPMRGVLTTQVRRNQQRICTIIHMQ